MLGSGPEPDDSGFLLTKVSQLSLSSKSGRSERPFALISGSEGGADGLSRAGRFLPGASGPLTGHRRCLIHA